MPPVLRLAGEIVEGHAIEMCSTDDDLAGVTKGRGGDDASYGEPTKGAPCQLHEGQWRSQGRARETNDGDGLDADGEDVGGEVS